MKFHFMPRNLDSSVESLSKLFKESSDSGVYSILLTYHSRQEDFWIKSAHIINEDIKTKVMIAIRTYAISPEYCAMMLAGFDAISKDKIMLNIVAGDLHPDETSVEDVIEINDLIKTSTDRVLYTTKWLEKFKSLDRAKSNMPELVISGISDQAIHNVLNYGEYSLCMYDYLKDNIEKFPKEKRKMCVLQVFVSKDDTHKKEIFDGLDEGAKRWSFIGNEEEILEQFLSMENIGITDVLVTSNEDYKKVFNLIKGIKQC
jgi:alkanesulfonate monooxygenase SsuD/methylene tetrahydromethanopterin reductase-like flavin-dependent oxidoreductase (luciferase family)